MIRRSLGTVVLHRELEDCPAPHRVARVTDCDVQMVFAIEACGQANMVERQYNKHEAPDGLIVDTARVGNGWTALSRMRTCAHYGRRIAVERIEVNRLSTVQQSIPGMVVNLQHVVHGFEHKAIARTQALIGRLDGELIAAVGEPLVVEV